MIERRDEAGRELAVAGVAGAAPRRLTPRLPLLFAVALSCQAGVNPDGIGSPCTADSDCATGVCRLSGSGGYCTAPCLGEGETQGCPPSSVCHRTQEGARWCLLICGNDDVWPDVLGEDIPFEDQVGEPCPEGSVCVDVRGTRHRACEPTSD